MNKSKHIRVAAVIIEHGKLLTMSYTYGGEKVYNLPGGNLEFGEKMKEALARELMEELGINVEAGEDVLTAEVHTSEKETVHQLFECKILSGEIELNRRETSAEEVCWISLKELENVNLYPSVGKYLLENEKSVIEDKYVGVIEQKWF